MKLKAQMTKCLGFGNFEFDLNLGFGHLNLRELGLFLEIKNQNN